MANPATTLDIEARWRPLSNQQSLNAEVFLDDAWRMIRRRIPTLEAAIATDDDLRADTVRVMANAVLRVMKNPDGKRQESIDDYSWTRDQAVSAGLLYISEDEWADLDADATPAGAFTIRPVYVPDDSESLAAYWSVP